MHPENERLCRFRHLYETNVSALVRFAQRYTSADAAEDMVQDIFLELWKNEKILDDVSSRSYLYTAVRNRCINYLKQQQTKNTISQAILEILQHGSDYFNSAENLMIEKEEIQLVYDRIEKLPERCRHIFKLSYFEGKKSSEIAILLDLSIRTVEHQLYLGLKILRSFLAR